MSRLADILGSGDGVEWMSHPERNCASGHPDDWFPAMAEDNGPPVGKTQRSRNRVRMARALCDGCPVAVQCLQHALDNDERHGVWGGTTPRQRADMLGRQAS